MEGLSCRLVKCSCRAEANVIQRSVLELWVARSEGRIQQCHAERSWRYGSLRAIVRMLQCITI